MNAPEVSIILPTFNEAGNLGQIIPAIARAINGQFEYEIWVVDDDSPDRTWETAEALARSHPEVHVLRRMGRRGLSSAVVEGFAVGRGRYLAVMDADLQHDEGILPQLRDALRDCTLAIGYREVTADRQAKWSRLRRGMSWAATRLTHQVLHPAVSDPMSGYFMIRREVYQQIAPHLRPRGFKILLEILHRLPRDAKVAEVGYTFRTRTQGESKLSTEVAVDFFVALFEMKFGAVLPLRFVRYVAVGLTGVGVNFAVLQGLLWAGQSGPVALFGATVVAMSSNFFLNNFWTFRDVALRAAPRLIKGWASFGLICLVGALINYSIAFFLSQHGEVSLYLSSIAGIAVAAVWNYGLNSRWTWR